MATEMKSVEHVEQTNHDYSSRFLGVGISSTYVNETCPQP